VLIVPLSDQREFHGFDPDEFTWRAEPASQWSTNDSRCSMCAGALHQVGAITLTANRKVGAPFHDAPLVPLAPLWLAVKAARLSNRTGADIATDAELGTLISNSSSPCAELLRFISCPASSCAPTSNAPNMSERYIAGCPASNANLGGVPKWRLYPVPRTTPGR
jgi:hypothetical protein